MMGGKLINNSLKRTKTLLKNQYGLGYDEWISLQSDWEIYRNKVRKLTEKQPLHLLENYDKPRGVAGVVGNYQLDHIISVSYGFYNNIPPEEIADISNLRFIPWRDNLKKHKSCE